MQEVPSYQVIHCQLQDLYYRFIGERGMRKAPRYHQNTFKNQIKYVFWGLSLSHFQGIICKPIITKLISRNLNNPIDKGRKLIPEFKGIQIHFLLIKA